MTEMGFEEAHHHWHKQPCFQAFPWAELNRCYEKNTGFLSGLFIRPFSKSFGEKQQSWSLDGRFAFWNTSKAFRNMRSSHGRHSAVDGHAGFKCGEARSRGLLSLTVCCPASGHGRKDTSPMAPWAVSVNAKHQKAHWHVTGPEKILFLRPFNVTIQVRRWGHLS